jgi:hypothetical protein
VTEQNKRGSCLVFVAGLAVIGLLVVGGLAALFWFSPAGTGEYRPSPDGAWTAHVSSFTRGTWSLEREHYIELKLVRALSNETVWRREHAVTPDDEVPPYGSRERRFISWADDSRSFEVPLPGGERAKVRVPAQ